jgi:hypothetical protein
MQTKIYASRKFQTNILLGTLIIFAGNIIAFYINGENVAAFVSFIIIFIGIILGIINYFLWPDRWRTPLFITDGNDLFVRPIGVNEMERERWKPYTTYIKIDADRKSKLKYLNEINKQRYELIFRGIKPTSIDIYVHNLSENDSNTLRSFILSNYGDKLISNKINPADRLRSG